MRTLLWVAVVVNQCFLLFISAMNIGKFEMSDFAFRESLVHKTSEEALLLKQLYKKLGHVKLLQQIELVISFAISVVLFSQLLGSLIGLAVALGTLLFIVLLVKLELIQRITERLFQKSIPFILKVTATIEPLLKIIGIPPRAQLHLPSSQAEFLDQIKRAPSTVLTPIQRQRLESVIGSEDKTVKHIMTPKQRVALAEPTATLGPIVLSDLQKSGHGYFPVATKNSEPEGILALSDVADVQLAKQHSSVREIMSPHIAWVEEETSLYELAQAFLEEKQYVVLVRDEEGEFSGLVTIADLMKNLLAISKE